MWNVCRNKYTIKMTRWRQYIATLNYFMPWWVRLTMYLPHTENILESWESEYDLLNKTRQWLFWLIFSFHNLNYIRFSIICCEKCKCWYEIVYNIIMYNQNENSWRPSGVGPRSNGTLFLWFKCNAQLLCSKCNAQLQYCIYIYDPTLQQVAF